MANKESLKFQEALAKKIKEWEVTEDFAEGSYNRQKLNRSLNLLLGSDPDVIIDMLGGDFVPKNPRDAMNLIRGLDLSTLKSMEILPLKGLGDKLVGHHGIAASTLHALRGMKPSERLKVYNGLSEMGQRFGMDPKQIFLIADKIHQSVAHEGDFKGIKTGVTLPYIAGETGDEFLSRFEAPMRQQLGALEQAVSHGETQKYYQAINTIEDNLQIPRGTLINPDTPLAVKDAATKLLKPTADQVREVVNAGDDIPGGVQRIMESPSVKPKAFDNFLETVSNNGVIKLFKNPAIRRGAALVPIAGTLIGAGTVEANAASRDEEIAANPNDPTLHVNKALDQISGWGDRTSLAGMAATATGVGAPVGVPATAVGELTSLGAGLASMAIDATRGTINLIRNPEKIKELKPANMEFTTM